ncbi:MAG: riboflavin synthase [bacterium]|nr:riboflavin synthase [bacterium]
MFTGLVEGLGRVVLSRSVEGRRRLGIEPPFPADGLSRGESVAVDGVCLTVVEHDAAHFEADVIAETLTVTTLGDLRPGMQVNVERSLRVGDRVGGHWVQGHVDGVGRLARRDSGGGEDRLRVEIPAELERYVARKGSIALQGVSLTVAAVGPGWFEVALIPETLERTTLGTAGQGDRLNLEVDLFARYLERMLESDRPPTDGAPGAGES